MAHKLAIEIDVGRVHIVSTDRSDGDFGVQCPASDLSLRRSKIIAHPWTWFHQVHSSEVLEVSHAGEHSGVEADASFTRQLRCPLSVTTADCGPVVLIAHDAIAVVHAGWRGALAGIIQRAGECLIDTGSRPVASFVGPMISASHYEFGTPDLQTMANRFGSQVAGRTYDGSPALDMARVVEAACAEVGFEAAAPLACTSEPQWFSYRTRSEAQRLATVAWIDD